MKENFEFKRQEMLRDLTKRRRDNMVKRKISSMHRIISEPSIAAPQTVKKKIAVYGADSFFIKNFINTLRLSNEVIYNPDVETLTGIVLDMGINNLVVDLDRPTDWRKSVDVFTTIKTINPEARFYVCTQDPGGVQAQTLEKQGGVILKKPIDFDHLYRSLE